MRPVPKFIGLALLLAMAGFAAVGFVSIRRDLNSLHSMRQDDIIWSATQMEVELLRFHLSGLEYLRERNAANLQQFRGRFEILWSRIFLMQEGNIGKIMRQYDSGFGTLDRISEYLKRIDPVIIGLVPDDEGPLPEVMEELGDLRQELRLYTLRVVRGDTAATALVRERIRSSSQTTIAISLGAVLLSILSLGLIMNENRRQRQISDMNSTLADQAERASRAKSQYLSMMSHELRNPLNGIMGPLALLEQSGLSNSQSRLVEQAQVCGQSMLQMLVGLLDYGEIQDGELSLADEPFQVAELAQNISAVLRGHGAVGIRIVVAPDCAKTVTGDVQRISQIFVHLCNYVVEVTNPENVTLTFTHDGTNLKGDISFAGDGPAVDWKLDLLIGLSDISPDRISAEALRPLLARGLISAAGGHLVLDDVDNGSRAISVSIPADVTVQNTINVLLETRSAAMQAIYHAALRSENITFVTGTADGNVDVVLVDCANAGGKGYMASLRKNYPGAVFVSIGSPNDPAQFDEIVDTPNDVRSLKSRILLRGIA